MKLYDRIINIIEGIKGTATNEGVSGSLTAELTIISTLVLSCILIRHLNIFLSIIVLLGLIVVLITNMPLMRLFRKEQENSLDQMLFYVIVTLGILFTAIFWGGNFV